jgi:4,5-DOPA dioxygenase extradiol
MNTLPSLFISHGSPLHALGDSRASRGWRDIAVRLPRPRAILMASAHWESELPLLSTATAPETIHDFGGFPYTLYRIRYAAPGAPEVAEAALAALAQAGIAGSAVACRGLDHGAWVPLLHMYPDADVPVAQISVQPQLDAAHHQRVGRALAPLAERGVLIVGSGHLTHNLREFFAQLRRGANLSPPNLSPPNEVQAAEPYVGEFAQWIERTLAAGDDSALADWHTRAPHARRAHPSDEHFLPLPLAYGAAGPQPRVERIDLGIEGGVLAMDAYLFHRGATR